jgi:hypothetical protein
VVNKCFHHLRIACLRGQIQERLRIWPPHVPSTKVFLVQRWSIDRDPAFGPGNFIDLPLQIPELFRSADLVFHSLGLFPER